MNKLIILILTTFLIACSGGGSSSASTQEPTAQLDSRLFKKWSSSCSLASSSTYSQPSIEFTKSSTENIIISITTSSSSACSTSTSQSYLIGSSESSISNVKDIITESGLNGQQFQINGKISNGEVNIPTLGDPIISPAKQDSSYVAFVLTVIENGNLYFNISDNAYPKDADYSFTFR